QGFPPVFPAFCGCGLGRVVEGGGDLGQGGAAGGPAGGGPVPAGERGFDLADADPGAARGEQGGQDGLAGTAGGLAAGKDVGAGQGVDGGVQGDGEAGAVGVGAGDGLGGECHLAADGLVEGEQGPDFLVQPGGVLRAQDPAVQQGVAQREVGDLVFPAFVVEAEQRGGRVAVVIGEGGGEPVPGGEPGPGGEGDGDLGIDDPDGQAADPGQVGAITEAGQGRERAAGGQPGQEPGSGRGDSLQEAAGIKAAAG